MLGECVDEAIRSKKLKGEDLCDIAHVADDDSTLSTGWQAIRFTCDNASSVHFRSFVRDYLIPKKLQANLVTTVKPNSSPTLYRKPARRVIFTRVALADLKQRIHDV